MGCHEELAYTSGHAWSKGARACQLFKVLKVELAAGTLAHLLFSKNVVYYESLLSRQHMKVLFYKDGPTCINLFFEDCHKLVCF